MAADSELTARARAVLAESDDDQRWWILAVARSGSIAARGIGAGRGSASRCRGMERRGLITIDRRHWRDHTGRATDLLRECARLLSEGTRDDYAGGTGDGSMGAWAMNDEQIEAFLAAVRERYGETEQGGGTWLDAVADCLREPEIYNAPRLLSEGTGTDTTKGSNQ